MTNEELVTITRGEDAKAADTALAQLVENNMGLITLMVRKYATPFTPAVDDLTQEGRLGVVVAAARFDLARGVSFSTYANHWIRAFVDQATRRGVTHSSRQRKIFYLIGKSVKALIARGVYDPSDAQIAEQMGESESEVTAVLAAMATVPVEMPNRQLVDHRPSPEEELVEATESRRRMFALNSALSALDKRERRIVLRHLSDKKKPLEVIGGELGISRERVRQIEALAFQKMREHMTRELNAA